MPGKVLGKHGIVQRDGINSARHCRSSLLSGGAEELVRLCDEAISAYLQKRGAAVYDHRRAALGYLSGSLRYEVLKRRSAVNCAAFQTREPSKWIISFRESTAARMI